MGPKPSVKFTTLILFVHRHYHFSFMNPSRTQGYVNEYHKDSLLVLSGFVDPHLKTSPYYRDVQNGPEIGPPKSKKSNFP
jgi:hypothetical protein